MNRSQLFDLCEMHLSTLCTRIELRGKLNILNFHLHCEDFYAGLLNLLFSYQLKNMNAYEQNAEGIDLIDPSAKVILQVSSTATSTKINSALMKDLSAYKGHGFRFVSISKGAEHLRKGKYSNPHGLIFEPASHIYDVVALLNIILHKDIVEQRQVYEYLKRELGDASNDGVIEESNLAAVINIIAKEDLGLFSHGVTATLFNVDEKVACNSLQSAVSVIDEYKIHHHRVDRIYAEFDLQGVNKSKSVLDAFRMIYIKLAPKYSGDELFFQVVEEVTSRVRNSTNYAKIPLDELELCVNVLAVDAFIRCKIFKEPAGAVHADA